MSALIDEPALGPEPYDAPSAGFGGPRAPMMDAGEARSWLVAERRRLEGAEPGWLEVLVDYDRSEAWQLDGFPNCASWLSLACGMARSTAYEKLRVGHQLRRRPVVAEAFRNGEISYSAVRSITSLDSPDPEVDEALVELARTRHHVWLERAVRHYQMLDDEALERRYRREEHRGVVVHRGFDGLGVARAYLTNDELDVVEAAMKAFMDPVEEEDRAAADGESATADSSTGGGGPDPSATADCSTAAVAGGPFDDDLLEADGPDPSATADSSTGAGEDWQERWSTRRADAFVEICATALANAQGGRALGVDRYMVHVVADAEVLAGGHGRCELVDGSPVNIEDLARICCDASFVGHLVGRGGEPLAVGRKCRSWSMPQRRAVTVRDGGRCRFPGCFRRRNEVHHVIPWENGGPTDVSNGLLLCGRHHSLIHAGYRTEGQAEGELAFYRSDGVEIGRTCPPGALPKVA